MTVLETLTEEQLEQLEDAQNKAEDFNLLESLSYGDEKPLNDMFKIYHYCEEDIVVIGFSDDDVEDWEVLQVLWNRDMNVVEFEAL